MSSKRANKQHARRREAPVSLAAARSARRRRGIAHCDYAGRKMSKRTLVVGGVSSVCRRRCVHSTGSLVVERASMARRCTRRASAGMAAGTMWCTGSPGVAWWSSSRWLVGAGSGWVRPGQDVGPALHESAFRGGAGGEQVGMPVPRHWRHRQVGEARDGGLGGRSRQLVGRRSRLRPATICSTAHTMLASSSMPITTSSIAGLASGVGRSPTEQESWVPGRWW